MARWLLEVGSWNLVATESWGIQSAGMAAYLWSLPREMTLAVLGKVRRRLYRHSRLYCREALHILVVFLTPKLIYVLLYENSTPAGKDLLTARVVKL